MKFPSVTHEGVHRLEVCLTSIFFKKGDESLLECLNPWNPLFGLNESVQNEKHTHEKKRRKKEENLSDASSNIPLRMNTEGSFEIAARIKSILLYPHQRTMEVIRGEKKKCLSFNYNLWEQETRLAQPPSYLTEVTRASLSQRQLQQMKGKQAWARCIHRCLEIADCCGLEWKLSPSEAVI